MHKAARLMNNPSLFLVLFGFFIAVMGLVLMLGQKISFLGRLPGDIIINRDGFLFFFPVGTSLVLSLVLTFLINLFVRLPGR